MKTKKIKVAVQGIPGAFHEEAAERYFKNREIEIVPCHSFPDLIRSTETGKSDYAVMAIENTVAGSILPNYALLQESDLEITGEYYMRIVQNLMALPGTKISELQEVFSHPMAIYQCRKFFREYPHIRLTESADTALSARDLIEFGTPERGAIAAATAAKRYGLEILSEGIEDDKKNYTRFFILNKKNKTKPDELNNKASLCFSLPHSTGSLSAVLSVFAFYHINLHKIQSHPIIGQPGQYAFHVDLVYTDYPKYRKCLQAIEPLTENIHTLGEYKEGYQSFRKIHTPGELHA